MFYLFKTTKPQMNIFEWFLFFLIELIEYAFFIINSFRNHYCECKHNNWIEQKKKERIKIMKRILFSWNRCFVTQTYRTFLSSLPRKTKIDWFRFEFLKFTLSTHITIPYEPNGIEIFQRNKRIETKKRFCLTRTRVHK